MGAPEQDSQAPVSSAGQNCGRPQHTPLGTVEQLNAESSSSAHEVAAAVQGAVAPHATGAAHSPVVEDPTSFSWRRQLFQ
jgi:hypothetical protein